MTRLYMFRRGDGNEGNFPRFIVELRDSDCAYSAALALLANEYIARSKTRRFIIRNAEIDGESDYGINATVYEGPQGETAFGAAWLTAELQPIDDETAEYERNNWARSQFPLRKALDSAALRLYRERAKRPN
ncbi:MAG: hypothetical protein ACXWHF_03005 [Chthoniobacterales bacterium]